MDVTTLGEAMEWSLSEDRYAELCPAFNQALIQAGCTTVLEVAMFCAQVGHESAGLRYMEEIADGSAYEGREDLGNIEPGDGTRYKGRGPIQITGRWNYSHISEWAHDQGYVDSPDFFVDNPEELASDQYGFLGVVWYWTVARNMNALADDIYAATRAVNGGLNGIDDRIQRFNNALQLGDALLPEGDSTVGAVEDGAAQLRNGYKNIRKPLNTDYLPSSYKDKDGPWPNDIWAAISNEVVWDGHTENDSFADLKETDKRTAVGLLMTAVALLRRIDKKLEA